MTLLDAPTYDPAKARMRKKTLIARHRSWWCSLACLVLLGLAAGASRQPIFRCDRSQGHAQGLRHLEPRSGLAAAPAAVCAIPLRPFRSTDWGHSSDWGDIKTHKITMSKTVGSGVVVGIEVNGQKTPVFLWVQRSNKTLGFSPCSFRQIGQELRTASSFSRLAGSSTWPHFWLRSICRNRPLSTLPGPTSTKVVTPWAMSNCMDSVQRTAPVTWRTRASRSATPSVTSLASTLTTIGAVAEEKERL
jgi:hypothetical protein